MIGWILGGLCVLSLIAICVIAIYVFRQASKAIDEARKELDK